MPDFLEQTTLERSATGHTDAEVPPYGDLTGTITPLGTWTSTTTTQDANCPAQNGQVEIVVGDRSWMTVGTWVILVGFGTFQVASVPPTAGHVVVSYMLNSPQTPNTTPLGTLIPSGTRIMIASNSDTTDSSAGLYYRWTDKSHDWIATSGASGVKADYNVVKTVGSVPGTCVRLKIIQGSGAATVTCIKVDSSGNVIAAGYFSGSVDFGNGAISTGGTNTDAFVASYTNANALNWLKTFGGVSNTLAKADDGGLSLALDAAGNVIVAGYFGFTIDFGGGATITSNGNADIFVVKYSSSGSLVWAKSFGGSGNDGSVSLSIGSNAASELFLAVPIQGMVNFGNGTGNLVAPAGTSMALVKLSSLGVAQWSKVYGGATSIFPGGLAVDLSGNLWVVGWGYGTAINMGGGTSPVGGSINMFFAKYSGTDGTHSWSKILGTTGENYGYGVAISPVGNAVFIGGSGGTIDFGGGGIAGGIFLVGYSSSGAYLWSQSYGGPGNLGQSVAVGPDGALVTSGQANATIDWTGQGINTVGNGYFVARFSISGSAAPIFQWAKRGDYNGRGAGNGSAFDAFGHLITAGWFQGSVNFGGISGSGSFSSNSGFIAQYAI